MTNLEYSIEKSLLSTILFAHHQKEDESYFNTLELKEELFKNPFHRLVAKQINHNRALGLSTQDEFITEAMAQNGTLTNQMLEIMTANPFSRHLFQRYYSSLKKVSLKSHWDI